MKTVFGKTPAGDVVEKVTLTNSNGTCIEVLTLGAIIHKFCVAMPSQEHRDIVLGFDNLDSYLKDEHYLGCVVGRYANRIHKGQFTLENKEYQVDINQAGNCLHGGSDGFNRRIWDIVSTTSNKLCLSLISDDGDQGYPGRLSLTVTYILSDEDTLTVQYRAESNQTTVFNPTQHSYFNLGGHNANSIAQHQLLVLADHILEVDDNGIPSGNMLDVKGSAFDFNQWTTIDDALRANNHLIKSANGLDHNWCLTRNSAQSFNASLTNACRDLELQVSTTMPGIQVYTGNFLPEHSLGKDGAASRQYQGVCLESQFYPDSPNQQNFPSTVLPQNEVFISETKYKVVAH